MDYDYEEVVPYLLKWFDYNARILPWRETPKPYYVWVSEIMLQQTRVETVKNYFERFISSLEDIKSLADAPEEKLLKLWEGLGYYSRVRNLQKAARIVVSEFGGELPPDYDKLIGLPGIGAYTAGAIASIAYGIPVPAVDGNVLRVTKRLAASYDDITKDAVKKDVWNKLSRIIPRERPGDFNQAMMELGATVCLPNGAPLCGRCPVMHLCRGFHEDIAMELPVKPAKKVRKLLDRTILLIEFKDKYAIRKRADQGLLAGLWELPGFDGQYNQAEVNDRLKNWGFTIDHLEPMGSARHIFSHIEWHMTGYHIWLKKITPAAAKENTCIWAGREEIRDIYTLPNAFAAYTRAIYE